MDEHVSREIVYETTATAPPEELHRFFLACREDGFQPARRRLRELLDRFGLAGTDLVNQLHRGLGDVPFLTESQKLSVTQTMAEADFRMVEGGGEALQTRRDDGEALHSSFSRAQDLASLLPGRTVAGGSSPLGSR